MPTPIRERLLNKIITRTSKEARGYSTGSDQAGSYLNTVTRTITLASEHAEGVLEEAVFTAAHEAGHHAITLNPNELGLRPELITNFYEQLGFGYVLNAIEDCADNDYIVLKTSTMAGKVQTVYDNQFRTEHSAMQTPATIEFTHRHGFIPSFVAFGSNIIRHWHQKRYSIRTPSDLKALLKSVETYSDRYINRIPDSSATKEEVKTSAQERFQIYVDHIFPIVKELAKQDMERLLKQNLLKGLGEGLSNPNNKNSPIIIAFDKLSPEEQEAIRELLNNSIPPNKNPTTPQPPNPLDILITNLPPDLIKELSKQAKGQLEALEDELNKDLLPQSIPEKNPPSHAQINQEKEKALEAEADRRAQAAANQKAKEELEQIIKNLKQEIEGGLSEYQKAQARVREYVSEFVSDISNILVANLASTWEGPHLSGGKLSIKSAMQDASRPRIEKTGAVWLRKEGPTDKSYHFVFLLDLSGSMASDGKIEAAYDTLVFLNEVFTKLKLPYEIYGFQNNLIPVKTLTDTDLGEALQTRVGNVKLEVQNSCPGGNNKNGFTDLGFAIKAAGLDLSSRSALAKCLVVLTDGAPNPSPAHAGVEYDTVTVLADLSKKSDIHVIGGGLGDDGDAVKELFKNHFTVKNMGALIPELKLALQRFIEDSFVQ